MPAARPSARRAPGPRTTQRCRPAARRPAARGGAAGLAAASLALRLVAAAWAPAGPPRGGAAAAARPACGLCGAAAAAAGRHGGGAPLGRRGRAGRGDPATVAHYGEEDRGFDGSLGLDGSERQAGWPSVVDAISDDLAEKEKAEPDNGGHRELSFGKHKGLTYQATLDADPNYCNYIARLDDLGTSWPGSLEFARWLREQGLPRSCASGPPTLGFGEYCDLTYEEAWRREPDYRVWEIRERRALARKGEPVDNPHLRRFVNYLQGRPRGAEDGRRVVGFGQHGSLTFHEVRSQHPEYCEWVLQNYHNGSNSCEHMVELVSWLQKEGLPGASGRSLVGFGQYQNSTYEQARREAPKYCAWVVTIQGGSHGAHVAKFAQWLQVLDFGPHRGLTFEEAWSRDPDYCADILRRGGQQEEALDSLLVFFWWLQGRIPASSVHAGLLRVGFGRHAGLTYQQARSQEPAFCRWHLEQAARTPAEEKFAQWLSGQRTFDDGCYCGLTFNEVRSKHPDYCEVVMKWNEDNLQNEFVQFLKDQGPVKQG